MKILSSLLTLAALAGVFTGIACGPKDGDDAVCQALLDEEGPDQAIVVRNERDTPIYLMTPGDCTHNYVRVDGPAGDAPGHWPANDCEPTCEAVMNDACACAGACAAPQLLRIERSGEYELDWPGFILVSEEMPSSCVSGGFCQAGSCPRAIAPPDGTYTVTAQVMFEPDECADPGDGSDPCACDAGESWCLTEAFLEGEPADLEAEVAVELPVGGAITLVVD